MKKLLFGLLLIVFFFPVSVFAKEKILVFMFYGKGCSHCEEATTFFNELDSSYQDKFELERIEVWYDEDNAKMMDGIAEMRNEEAAGVPYILIGNQSWVGFDKSKEKEFLAAIDSEYEKDLDERYSLMLEYSKYKYPNAFKDEDDDDFDWDDIDSWDDDDDEEDNDRYEYEHYSSPFQYLTTLPGILMMLVIGFVLLFGLAVVVGLVFLIIYLVKKDKKKG
ncbi:MAG: hypothetical protein IKF71_01625 [Bacilli bacterium]|nr:hypothetical protein [Bacilli bacterium]